MTTWADIHEDRYAASFHPCAISVSMLSPTRYEIIYQHALVKGICTRCHENVELLQKIRGVRVPVIDIGKIDA